MERGSVGGWAEGLEERLRGLMSKALGDEILRLFRAIGSVTDPSNSYHLSHGAVGL
jgi:hypothetical protein